jgi:hypothetical protein
LQYQRPIRNPEMAPKRMGTMKLGHVRGMPRAYFCALEEMARRIDPIIEKVIGVPLFIILEYNIDIHSN